MKTFFSAGLIAVSALLYSQQSIRFESGRFEDILAKAKSENKLVFLDAYASWCGPCKLMEKNVFTDKAVQSYYDMNFINARIDMEKGEGPSLASRYQVASYPSFLYLNGSGEVVFRSMGYLPANDFLAMGKQANNPLNRNGGIKEQFAKGESDAEFLKNAVKMYANTDREFARAASERYFVQKKSAAYSQEEVSMLIYFLQSVKDPNYKVFVRDKAEITKVLPVNLYDQINNQLKMAEVAEKSVNTGTKTVNDQLYMSGALQFLPEDEARDALNQFKLRYYAASDNFAKYQETALLYYKDGDGFSGQELGQPAFLFAEKSTDAAALKQALQWAVKINEQGETLQSAYILAKLQMKTGDVASARKNAATAMALAKSAGADATPVQMLIDQLKE